MTPEGRDIGFLLQALAPFYEKPKRQTMTISNLGSVLAIIALVLAIVFVVLGQMTVAVAGLIVLLAIARLT